MFHIKNCELFRLKTILFSFFKKANTRYKNPKKTNIKTTKLRQQYATTLLAKRPAERAYFIKNKNTNRTQCKRENNGRIRIFIAGNTSGRPLQSEKYKLKNTHIRK